MSQLSCRHGPRWRDGENERLMMNQSEVETLALEWLSRAEGQPRSETHALTL